MNVLALSLPKALSCGGMVVFVTLTGVTPNPKPMSLSVVSIRPSRLCHASSSDRVLHLSC